MILLGAILFIVGLILVLVDIILYNPAKERVFNIYNSLAILFIVIGVVFIVTSIYKLI